MNRTFRWRCGGQLGGPANTEFWSPTLTDKDPQVPNLPLETAASAGFSVAWAVAANTTIQAGALQA